jgi:hypothetical protein
MIRNAPNRCPLDYPDPDTTYAFFRESDPFSGTARQVEAAAPDVWTAIIYTYDHRTAITSVRYSYARTDREGLRRGRQFIGIESLTIAR